MNSKVPFKKLSPSKLATWFACPQRYKFAYIDGLKPKTSPDYLQIGSLAHKGMEEAWHTIIDMGNTIEGRVRAMSAGEKAITRAIKAGEDADGASDKEREQVAETARQVFSSAWSQFPIEQYAVAWFERDYAVERELTAPLIIAQDEVMLHGFTDVILEKNDTAYIVDYKFRTRLTDPDDDMANLQNMVYAYLYNFIRRRHEEEMPPLIGVMLWEARNKPMTMPRINKDGTISRAKINCTWDMYAAFCSAHGQNPMLYTEEMQPKLSGYEHTRVTCDFLQPETCEKAIEKIVIPAARQIRAAHEHPESVYPHMNSFTCKDCPYNVLCTGEIRGYDVDEWKEEFYEHADISVDTEDETAQDADTENIEGAPA